MHTSGLTPAVLTLSCAMLAGSALTVAAPDAETAPVTVTPPVFRTENALSSAEVEQLRQTIKGLHQRFEDQARILESIQGRLDTVGSRLEQSLRPADLDSLRESVGTLVARVAETRTAVTQLAGTLEKTGSSPGFPPAASPAAAAQLHDQIAALADDLARWQRDLAVRMPAAAPTPAGVDFGTMVMVVAAATLIVGGLVLFFGLNPRGAPQTEAVLAVASLGQQIGQLRDQLATQATRPASQGEPSLSEIVSKLQGLIARLEAPAPIREPAAVVPRGDSGPPMRGATAGAGATPAALWPEPFRDPASPLARWRAALESDLSSPDRPALPVLAALLALRVVAGRPTPGDAEVGDAVAALSEALHRYWESLPDLSEDDLIQASGEWIDAVRPIIAAAAPRLSIEQVVPGLRFDANTMQTVRQGSGNHLNVATVHSWVIRDLSGERPKVLHRARAATT